jgi:gas vesicle protein
MSDNRSSSVQSFMTGAIIGGAVGAAFALLYAPKKGSELREDISDTAQDLSASLSSLVKRAKEAGADLIGKGIDSGDEVVQEAYRKAESLIEEADRIISDARARVNGG